MSLDAAIDRQAVQVGARIRALRRARGLTLEELGARCELSHPFLSQLERGRARPSMVSLERIARALGSSQLELLAGGDDTASTIVRAAGCTRGHYAEGEARMLVHGTRSFHPMEFRGSNLERGDYFVHAEDEFIHVVEGSCEVDLGEQGVSVLVAGDSLYYVGGTPHRWRALEPGGYRLFVVKEKPEQL
ncbi:MAG: XRE family transcriptional regulator [Actinobacteria bacterium]|nr:XRE family transcriptional regulator [Actinomycetota bacterium]